MIRSMTGFAAVSREDEGDRVNVTIKSVNHRFLDTQVKAPQTLGAVESRVRGIIQQRLTRGRIEVSLSLDRTAAASREVVVDEALLRQVAEALEPMRASGLVSGGLSVSDVFRIPQAVDVRAKGDLGLGLSGAMALLVETVVTEAVEALAVMRATEGRLLEADLDARLAVVAAQVGDLERMGQAGQTALADRLRERLAGLPADLAGDAAALAQEVVRFVARSDIDEEIVRLRAHMDHWRELARSPDPCGRKLDFLLQEMNREVNTIGSKVEGGRATETVIAVKAELERLREQVQNVE